MKRLTRLFVHVKMVIGFPKNKSAVFEKNKLRQNGYHLGFLRFAHESRNLFEGPSLKDFLSNEGKNNTFKCDEMLQEDVPYLTKFDTDGNGQKVFFEIHGCQMNVSDAEIILSILQRSGYQRTTDLKDADIVLILTCSIRDSAEISIWHRLNELKAFKIKTQKKHMKIGILGCVAERLKTKILEIDKSVDVIAGPDSYKDLPRLLALTRNNQKGVNVLLSFDETYADVMPVRLNENDITAYVSIMRGCDNMCTYCIVPFTRGKERSRPLDSILSEVKMLSDKGVKQITLLGQNVNSYRDISSINHSCYTTGTTKMSSGFKTVYKPKSGGIRFDTLLDKVAEINPEIRIRFTSPHPKDFPVEVLQLIQDRKNICCNIHLPAQSGSNAVLERMRRGYTREAYISLVEKIRSVIPDVSLTTDMITGFCGETEKDHENTLDLIRLIQYHFMYFFPYSMREKTTAHRRYVDDVPKDVKMRRMFEIRETSRTISKRLNEEEINKTQLILVEGVSKKSTDHFAGRNDKNTKVILPNSRIPTKIDSKETSAIKPGDYVAVTIKEANAQVLKGIPLYHTTLSEFDDAQYRESRRNVDVSL